MDNFWAGNARPITHRQRSRKACQPCRQRKRKCDGLRPCHCCQRYSYDCYYSKTDRHVCEKKLPANSEEISPSSSNGSNSPNFPVTRPARLANINASRSSPITNDSGLHLLTEGVNKHIGWNLGTHSEPHAEEINFTEYLSWNEFQRLSEAFFRYVHPIFQVLNRKTFEDRAQARYSPRWKDRNIDPVICGVAALGSFFSIGSTQSSHQHEPELVELAKSFLDHSSAISKLTEDDVVAWILRTIYLRATSPPISAWLASCTTMHIIEAMDLGQITETVEVASSNAFVSNLDRLVGIATTLNRLISLEYRKPPINAPKRKAITAAANDLSEYSYEQFIALGAFVEATLVNGDQAQPRSDLMTIMTALMAILKLPPVSSPELQIFKASTALCLCRRLVSRTTSATATRELPSDVMNAVVTICLPALSACLEFSSNCVPWWPLLSVPFHFLCLLLMADAPETLAHIPETLVALEQVCSQWHQGSTARVVLALANYLMDASRRRKRDDLALLGVSADDSITKLSLTDTLFVTTTATAAMTDLNSNELSLLSSSSYNSNSEEQDFISISEELDALADAESDLNGYLEGSRHCGDGTVSPDALQLPSPISPTFGGSGTKRKRNSPELSAMDKGTRQEGEKPVLNSISPTIDWARVLDIL